MVDTVFLFIIRKFLGFRMIVLSRKANIFRQEKLSVFDEFTNMEDKQVKNRQDFVVLHT